MKQMHRKTIGLFCGIAAALVLLVCAGAWYYVQSGALMERAAGTIASTLTDQLGTETQVGSMKITSLHDATLHDIAIYDKQAQCIVRAPEAQVHLRLLSVFQLKDNPASAIETVTVTGAEATVERRDDGTWNIADISPKSSGGSGFSGKIVLEDARVTGRIEGRELTLENVAGSIDFAEAPAYKVDVAGENQGASVHASGTLSSDRQILNVEVADVDAANYLALIPDGLLPDGIRVLGGKVKTAKASLYRRADVGDLSMVGQGEVEDGAVDVQGIEIRDVQGFTHFTNREVGGDLTAAVQGQAASVHGSVRFDTTSPAMNLEASAEAFDPAPLLAAIAEARPQAAAAIAAADYAGPVSVTAKVGGTFSDPMIDGDVTVASGQAAGISFQNASAHARLLNRVLYLQNVHAGVFGGQVTGEGELSLDDQAYTAHVKADNIDVAAVQSYAATRTSSLAGLDALTGRAHADVTAHGKGAAIDDFWANGSVSLAKGSYGALPIDNLSASLAVRGRDIKIDYLSAKLPNNSNLGLEGEIRGGEALDLAFYGGHFDLSLLKSFDARADITGFCDFKGQLTGSLSDPAVTLDFSANHGKAFQQPFDSLVLRASGSLDRVTVDDFLMENGGKETWLVTGSIGLTGEKALDLRVDCMGARMEDIAALVAPGQPITGNVDNTIHFTGTLDHPEAVGYIHFYRGSYRGVLLSGMDGDYFLKDDVLRLQVFHIYSPMVDAVLNGTVGLDESLNLDIDVRDIDMKRVEHKLPYEVSGHGTFEGHVTGFINAPIFDGTLDAKSLTLNGVDIPRAYGHAHYESGMISLDRFGFLQGDGSYDLELQADTESHALTGNVVVQDADLTNLCALLNQKNDFVQGTMNATAIVGGTAENPYLDVEGTMAQGTIAGYDVHGVEIAAKLEDRVLHIDTCKGQQGSGTFELTGTTALDGTLGLKLTARDIALGMFTKAAGLKADVLGTADIDATLSGSISSPEGQIALTAKNGGIQGSTFDTLSGEAKLFHGIVDVKNLVVQKTVGTQKNAQTYQASAKGIVPLHALVAGGDEELADFEQIHLEVSLDHADLSLLPMLSDQVEWAVGETRGNVLITGTAAHPLFSGKLSLPDGAVKLKLIQTPIESLHGVLTLQGNEIKLEELSGKMGKGTFTGSGHLALSGLTPETYAADLTADGLEIASVAYKGPITGAFHVENSEIADPAGNIYYRPKLSGHLDFDNCEVSIPMIPEGDGVLPDVLLDVDVTAGENVHFYSSSLYDMYITGAAHFGGSILYPSPTGEFHVKRGGTVSYLKNVFRIREGTATFDQVESFLPSIKFLADTKVGSTSIYLRLEGALNNNMEVHLTSNPEYSQTEILTMLTLQSSYKRGSMNLDASDIVNIGLQMTVLGQIEEQMRSLLWLDTFRISRGSGSVLEQQSRGDSDNDDENVYNVEMGKRIGGKTQLHYVRAIGGNSTQRYGFQYDLSDAIGFTLDRESGDTVVGVEARYKF